MAFASLVNNVHVLHRRKMKLSWPAPLTKGSLLMFSYRLRLST